MEALERLLIVPNWMTSVLLFSFLLLTVLKIMNPIKFVGTLTSITNKGFLEIEAEDKQPVFSGFIFIFGLFSLLTISLAVYISITAVQQAQASLLNYLKILTFVLIYMVSRFLLENLLVHLFSISNNSRFFFQSKQTYLHFISVGLWVFVVLYLFAFQNIFILWSGCCLLFCIRLISLLNSNKILIFNNLFYFILYICTFEIAPLLILYKLMT